MVKDAQFLAAYLLLSAAEGFTSFYYCCGKDDYYPDMEHLIQMWLLSDVYNADE